MSGRRVRLGAALAIAGLLASGVALGLAHAASPDDRILPAEKHTSDKGRALARKYQRALAELNAEVYHCMPWLDVRHEGIGFYKPRHLQGDVRYLSLNVEVDQQPSAEFSALPVHDRASRMFSRYVPALLRRMTREAGLMGEPLLEGFTVILSWLKQEPRPNERPVLDTIAVFLPRPQVADFLAGRATAARLAETAHVIAWDGETKLGEFRVRGWEDNFVATYRIANYQPASEVTCR